MSERLEFVISARDEFSGEINKLNSSMVPSLNAIGTAVVAAFSVAAIVDFGKECINTASALEETNNKFNVVFAGQEDIANQWAETLASDYLMSENAAKKYLASIQDLLVPMGMNSDAAARLSNETVKLAADLGSFNNVDTERVISDIQSALVGNYETMKKYGVVLTATTVQEEALAMGLAKTKDALTAADKAQAAYQIITRSSTAAVGDMERSSDSYANTSKRLEARTEDLEAALGDIFLPTATRVVDVLADMAEAASDAFKGDEATPFSATARLMEDEINMLKRELQTLTIGIDDKQIDAISERIKSLNEGLVELSTLESGIADGVASVGTSAASSIESVSELTDEQRKSLVELQGLHEKYTLTEEERLNSWYARQQELFKGNEDALVALKETYEARKSDLQSKSLENISSLHDQYCLTEEERLTAWYEKQKEMFIGNEEALIELKEVYDAIKNEAELANYENLALMHDEYMLSEEEKLQAWYDKQKEMFKGNKDAMQKLDDIYAKKKATIDEKNRKDAITNEQNLYSSLETIGSAFGKRGVLIAKMAAIPQAIMSMWAGAAKALELPFPANLAAAAGVIATGMGFVSGIRGAAYGMAHGGLDYVPREQTYLLDKGERVLSPNQNADLKEFMKGGGGNVTVAEMHFHVLENATNADAMLTMDADEWAYIVEDKVIPALSALKKEGKTV